MKSSTVASRRRSEGSVVGGEAPARTWVKALWIGAVPGALLFAYMQVSGYVGRGMVGADSHAYWSAAHHLSLAYDRPAGSWDAYLYSPAFAQVLWPAAQLGWHAFQILWFVAQVGVVAWLVRPLAWWQGVVVALFVAGEFVLGNVYIFFAALVVAVVCGRPTGVVPLALTKVAPAVIGVWYVVRGEWRLLVRGVAATAAVVVSSVLIAPAAWSRWVTFVFASSESHRGTTALVRLALAVLLTIVAARVNRSVVLAPVLILASPIIGGLTYFAVLLALPRLLERDREIRRRTADVPHDVEPRGGG